jgi:hypothetical protein
VPPFFRGLPYTLAERPVRGIYVLHTKPGKRSWTVAMVENLVKISGKLHFVEGESFQESRVGKYLVFSVKQETPWEDGSIRRDFLLMRAFDPAIQRWVLARQEDTPVRIEGKLRSSSGSGKMYISVETIEEVKEN